jgi:capsule polysaccharide export protein KpsC/LpsZ
MGSGLTILYYLLAPSRLEQVAAAQDTTSQFVDQYKKFVEGEHF